MGKFYSASIAVTDATARVTSISNWFNNLEGVSSELVDYTYNSVTVRAAKITIDDTDIEILFGLVPSHYGTSIVHVFNTEDKKLIPDSCETGNDGTTTNAQLYAYIDDNCVLLSLYQSNTYNPTTNGFQVVYVKTSDDKHLVGYFRFSARNSDMYADMPTLTFEDVDDSARVPYNYTNMFPYVATAGTIDFTNEAFFVDGNNVRAFSTEALKECSTVTMLSTQSLPTGNCVALGAHCLAPLDDE